MLAAGMSAPAVRRSQRQGRCALTPPSPDARHEHAARLPRVAGLDQCRHGLRAQGLRPIAARLEGTAGRRCQRARTWPRIANSRRGRGCPGACALLGRHASRPCVYGCARAWRREAAPARARPRGRHTSPRRRRRWCATTPRLCVMKRMLMPVSRCRRRMSARICAWIVTSSAVVGSSAMRSVGSQAIAIAIITRCRMPPESWCGYSPRRRAAAGISTCSSRRSASARAAALSRPLCRRSDSAICSPMLKHRVEARHRLLEDHRDLVAAQEAHARLGQREQVEPLARAIDEPGFAADPRRRAARQEAHQRQAGDRFARPRFADQRGGLAGADREAHVGHRIDAAFVGAERGAEVADFETVHRSGVTSTCASADRAGRGCRRRAAAARAR